MLGINVSFRTSALWWAMRDGNNDRLFAATDRDHNATAAQLGQHTQTPGARVCRDHDLDHPRRSVLLGRSHVVTSTKPWVVSGGQLMAVVEMWMKSTPSVFISSALM